MSLYRRPGSPHWWTEFQVRGTRIQRSTGTASRRDAAAVERRLRDEARSATKATVMSVVRKNVSKDAVAITDESRIYEDLSDELAHHASVNHARGEYVSRSRSEWLRGDITTNGVESYFALFKRGMRGTYQHCKEKHLHRYLAEFDFRHSNRARIGINDQERSARAILGVSGKRLKYKDGVGKNG